MKANQPFRDADDAVSPVVGVILMVAITVVLAAVVFVLVNNLGKGTNSAPNLTFTVNDNQDRLEIISASTGANWNRLTVVATACGPATTVINVGGAAVPHQNVAATAAAKAAVSSASCTGTNTPVTIATTSANIVAGDFLSFCATTLSAINVNIQVVDTGANSQIGSYSFPSIALCV